MKAATSKPRTKVTLKKTAPTKKAAPKKAAPAKRAVPKKAAPKKVAPAKKAAPAKKIARKAPAKRGGDGGSLRALGPDPRDVVTAVFEAAGWEPRTKAQDDFAFWLVETPEEPVLGAVEAELYLDASRFVMFFVHREPVPAEHRAAVMELVTRLNDELVDGSYALGLDSGILRFRTGLDFSGTALAPVWLRNLILHGAQVVSAHEEILAAVAAGDAEPQAAMASLTGGAIEA